jgi:hypothetical protein
VCAQWEMRRERERETRDTRSWANLRTFSSVRSLCRIADRRI